MNLLFEGIKYQLHAKKRHGIHSPFVYSLSDQGLQSPISKEHRILFRKFDEKQSQNKDLIKIKDYGAGSKKLSSHRSVREMHKISSSGKHFGNLLYRISNFLKPKIILELGTSLGRGTLALHLGYPEAAIISVEGDPKIASLAKENIQQLAINPGHISVVEGTFSSFLTQAEPRKFDLIFIDGHHQGEALLGYLDQLKNFSHEHTAFILDDIRWNQDMLNTWKFLIEDQRFHLSIDFFRMGILFKRPDQAKEHFILKS